MIGEFRLRTIRRNSRAVTPKMMNVGGITPLTLSSKAFQVQSIKPSDEIFSKIETRRGS